MAGYRCFWSGPAPVAQSELILDAAASRHLVKALRVRQGEAVTLFDGQGRAWGCTLQVADGKAAVLAVGPEQCLPRSAVSLGLAVSVPKGKTMDGLIRMAVEIGLQTLQPLWTAHGEVRLSGDRLAQKLEHWRTTAIEAAKQSGQLWLPEIHPPVALTDWLAQSPQALLVVGSLEPGSRPLVEALPSKAEAVTMVVGPEGDFSPAEYQQLQEAGALAVRLAAGVLRVDTACAYLLSVADALLRRSKCL